MAEFRWSAVVGSVIGFGLQPRSIAAAPAPLLKAPGQLQRRLAGPVFAVDLPHQILLPVVRPEPRQRLREPAVEAADCGGPVRADDDYVAVHDWCGGGVRHR
jgi:hypothetical protein